MAEWIHPYMAIALKLITGMIGILVFLRIAGKGQMAQITPLDTVSAFVIGALVGGVLYNPDMSMWHILFALAVRQWDDGATGPEWQRYMPRLLAIRR